MSYRGTDLTELGSDWCDEQGRFPPEMLQRIQAALHTRTSCVVCGATPTDGWGLNDSPCALSAFDDRYSKSMEKGLILVTVGCPSCGNILLFRLDVLLGIDPS